MNTSAATIRPPTDQELPPLLRATDIAQLLRVSRPTAIKLIKEEIAHVRRGKRGVLVVPLAEWHKWLERLSAEAEATGRPAR